MSYFSVDAKHTIRRAFSDGWICSNTTRSIGTSGMHIFHHLQNLDIRNNSEKSILFVKNNLKFSCLEFFTHLKSHPELLRKIIYNFKRNIWLLIINNSSFYGKLRFTVYNLLFNLSKLRKKNIYNFLAQALLKLLFYLKKIINI